MRSFKIKGFALMEFFLAMACVAFLSVVGYMNYKRIMDSISVNQIVATALSAEPNKEVQIGTVKINKENENTVKIDGLSTKQKEEVAAQLKKLDIKVE